MVHATRRVRRAPLAERIVRNLDLYLFLVPVLVYVVIFHYGPMYGVQIAFKDFLASRGISGSPWVGFGHFQRFFRSFQFWTLIRNTIGISLYQLAAGFPAPIILALFLNAVRRRALKTFVQTVTYAPHFISTVVMVGIILIFLSPRSGVVNAVLSLVGLPRVNFMAKPELFKTIYVLTGIWQQCGWSAVIYLAALAGVNPELYEAAIVDGANRMRRIVHIDIPAIAPTMVVLLILNSGSIMSVGFEKVFLMQNALNLPTSEVISTYVYKVGLMNADYSYSSAIGLFNSVINFGLLVAVNTAARRLTAASLW